MSTYNVGIELANRHTIFEYEYKIKQYRMAQSKCYDVPTDTNSHPITVMGLNYSIRFRQIAKQQQQILQRIKKTKSENIDIFRVFYENCITWIVL